MRKFYLAVIIIFAGAMLLFALQNRASVTISFLTFSVDAPFAIVIAVTYALGAATGGSLYSLLRRSYQASQHGNP